MKLFVWIPRVSFRAFFLLLPWRIVCVFIHLFMEFIECRGKKKMAKIKPFVCVKSQKWDDYGLVPVVFLNYGCCFFVEFFKVSPFITVLKLSKTLGGGFYLHLFCS